MVLVTSLSTQPDFLAIVSVLERQRLSYHKYVRLMERGAYLRKQRDLDEETTKEIGHILRSQGKTDKEIGEETIPIFKRRGNSDKEIKKEMEHILRYKGRSDEEIVEELRPLFKFEGRSDEEIIEDLEGLRKGQEKLGSFVSEGFAKGKDRMDGLEEMFKDHIDTTKNNHKEAMSAISGLNIEIKDNKIKDVIQENNKKSEDFKAYKKEVWGVVKTLIIGVVMLLVGAVVGKLIG